ncbi:Meckel syndrome type 1 protein [Streptomyces sp. TLI_053]|uniref:hypothetical protein n=1 Tax=Streptomyces sp. TLI_053 TaxID=1855352 RepID=UPI00087A9B8D|nr:hypothetical protein [Streptomyces sp. TLI_053]SDS83490.1 Meckel syndrome type 1 protein [Streptomyces sp. TLI_053]
MRSAQTRVARLAALAVPAALGLTLLTGAPGMARPAAAPGLDAAAQQAGVLGALAGVTQPATELVALAAKSPDGTVPEADATRLRTAVGAAIDKLQAALPAAAPAAPVAAPGLPVTPPVGAPAEPPAGVPAVRAQAAPTDLVATAAANLRKSVDQLAAPAAPATTPAVGTIVLPAPAPAAVPAAPAEQVVKDTVNLVAATVLGGTALPKPDLAGLPALPGATG